MENTTYILFGSTNGYQAQGSGLFRGRTKIAIRASYCPREQESKALLDECYKESDNHTYNKWGTAVQQMISCDEERNTIEWGVIMELGEMSYYHDGYSYESIASSTTSKYSGCTSYTPTSPRRASDHQPGGAANDRATWSETTTGHQWAKHLGAWPAPSPSKL
jgi:hypothetical protein